MQFIDIPIGPSSDLMPPGFAIYCKQLIVAVARFADDDRSSGLNFNASELSIEEFSAAAECNLPQPIKDAVANAVYKTLEAAGASAVAIHCHMECHNGQILSIWHLSADAAHGLCHRLSQVGIVG